MKKLTEAIKAAESSLTEGYVYNGKNGTSAQVNQMGGGSVRFAITAGVTLKNTTGDREKLGKLASELASLATKLDADMGNLK